MKISAKLTEARRKFEAAQEKYVEKRAEGKRAKKAHRLWHKCRKRVIRLEAALACA